MALASLWNSFQDETVLISVLSNLITHLEQFLGTHELFPKKILQDFLDEVTVKTDICRIKEHLGNYLLFTLLLKVTFFVEFSRHII